MSGFLWIRGDGDRKNKRKSIQRSTKTLVEMDSFIILILVTVSRVYTYVSSSNCEFYAQFTVCQLYFKKAVEKT